MSNKEDKVYARPLKEIEPFSFNESVADVFENMITRSVPGYTALLDFIGVLTEKFCQANSNCYDLGCSLGATTLQIRKHIPHPSCQIVAVDNSRAMVERCKKAIERDHSETKVDVKLEDIKQTSINNASVVALNFTLQFIAPDERQLLLNKIARGTNKNGILVLSEKILLKDEEEQQLITDLHHEFKKQMGYSDLEIAQKRSSLENVLVPDTLDTHYERLKKAGFSRAQIFFQSFNFVSILAIK